MLPRKLARAEAAVVLAYTLSWAAIVYGTVTGAVSFWAPGVFVMLACLAAGVLIDRERA